MSTNRVTVNGKTYIIKGGTYSTVFNGKVYSDGEVYLDGERIYCKKPIALRILKFLLFIMAIYIVLAYIF
ncbi:hypothetical protein [Fusobacterium nucleatum]|uniref:hypothetical protein n=1 Tax=Fusobacterium nucleatum TaxID=851 RepID=UPI00309536B9